MFYNRNAPSDQVYYAQDIDINNHNLGHQHHQTQMQFPSVPQSNLLMSQKHSLPPSYGYQPDHLYPNNAMNGMNSMNTSIPSNIPVHSNRNQMNFTNFTAENQMYQNIPNSNFQSIPCPQLSRTPQKHMGNQIMGPITRSSQSYQAQAHLPMSPLGLKSLNLPRSPLPPMPINGQERSHFDDIDIHGLMSPKLSDFENLLSPETVNKISNEDWAKLPESRGFGLSPMRYHSRPRKPWAMSPSCSPQNVKTRLPAGKNKIDMNKQKENVIPFDISNVVVSKQTDQHIQENSAKQKNQETQGKQGNEKVISIEGTEWIKAPLLPDIEDDDEDWTDEEDDLIDGMMALNAPEYIPS